MAYKLALPSHLTKIHDVFHVSILRKAEVNLPWVLPQIPLEIDEDLTFELRLEKVFDHSEKELRSKRILMIKILWRNSQIKEMT
jgi:hypothetical protein